MSLHNLAQIAFLIFVLILLIPLVGNFMARLFQGERTFLHPLLGGFEAWIYRSVGVNPTHEMTWNEYLKTLLLVNGFGFIFLFTMQLLQGILPLNPESFPGVSWPLAFNTAVSFVTNTNWQSYAGETSLSYATQMLGLTSQNFLSAATGNAALLVLIRGINRRETTNLGNFYADFTRTILYLLIPLSIILSLLLVSQGVVQTLSSYQHVTTIEGGGQIIPRGPVASQVAIKQLGTNGGGFFNANGAHPFENPTPFSNFLELLSIFLIPAATVYMYGVLVGSRRHGWLILAGMTMLFFLAITLSFYSEWLYNPVVNAYPNMEGKETRFGIPSSLFWAISTTATSNGSVNSMLSSLSPLAGGAALVNMMLEELVFGGIGVGLSSMIMFVFLTVFLAGLMVGRTPEYQGKKIEKREIQWVMAALLTPGALILIGSAISCFVPFALSSLSNTGPHGFTELLYAFTSTTANNGSAFAGLNANTLYYNLVLGVVMLLGRISIIVPAIALAGVLANKRITPETIGTFGTDSWLFAFLLLAVILIVGALSFFPALALGPIVEHLLMLENRAF